MDTSASIYQQYAWHRFMIFFCKKKWRGKNEASETNFSRDWKRKGLNICQYLNSNVCLQLFKTNFSLNENFEWETQRSMFEWINKISKLIREKRSDLSPWFKGTVIDVVSSDPLNVMTDSQRYLVNLCLIINDWDILFI